MGKRFKSNSSHICSRVSGICSNLSFVTAQLVILKFNLHRERNKLLALVEFRISDLLLYSKRRIQYGSQLFSLLQRSMALAKMMGTGRESDGGGWNVLHGNPCDFFQGKQRKTSSCRSWSCGRSDFLPPCLQLPRPFFLSLINIISYSKQQKKVGEYLYSQTQHHKCLFILLNFNNINQSHNKMADLAKSILTMSYKKKKAPKDEDQLLDELTKGHQNMAVSFYEDFQSDLIHELSVQLTEIKKRLQLELGRTARKLETKIRGNYMSSLSSSFNSFYIESFIKKEVKEVKESIFRLREKVNEYINEFCSNVLFLNLKKSEENSLYHFSNQIKALHSEWHSVTSRCYLKRAQILVSGFNRPETTWLALGVSKKIKQYGVVKKTLAREDFMGNIYLNGSDTYTEEYRLKKDLNNDDVFVIESNNRMVWVYRKSEGKNKKETFILDDNVDYYFYIAMKGPITLSFRGQ